MFTTIQNGSMMLNIVENTPNKGILRALDLFNRETLVVTSPKGIKDLLQNNAYDFEKSPFVKKLLKLVLGDGLVVVEGAEHKEVLADGKPKMQRKALLPAFSFRHVKELYPLFWSKSNEMVDLIKQDLRQQTSDGTIEISDWATRVALDLIGIAGFGVDFRSLTNPETPLNVAYKNALQPGKSSRFILVLALLISSKLVRVLPTKKGKELREGSVFIRKYIRGMLDARSSEKADVDGDEDHHKDIISVATKYGNFTTESLIDQAQTFLGAGHDTSSANLTWAIYVCSQPEYKHVQDRLRSEIRSQLPSPASGTEITAEMLDKLPYLEAVCKEVTRLYPAVPLIRRYCVRDSFVDGVAVRKGTSLMVPTWALHRSKELWGETAKDFNPERWLEGEKAANGGMEGLAYLTFAYGARQCIGKSFATAEFKALLAALVGSFEIEAVDDPKIKIEWGVVAKIRGGYRVRLKTLDAW
ncbi:hypothetical protein BP6252_05411 [Coleophoma cylindrospora]|uniref:Cytochrome P450 n=1 Tax=Coleophoma cylindrospora TaxID=1849047 RepID=A0A3D8RTR9_9HELO|nr:hypothetical protein BP6252_05411 [Coleophoma cylindrospora]